MHFHILPYIKHNFGIFTFGVSFDPKYKMDSDRPTEPYFS